jgi:phosphatidate cytidylyltransferase
MIWKRWLTAVVGVPALLALCWWGVTPFALTMTAVAAAALGEMIAAQDRTGLRTNLIVAVIGLLGPALPVIFPHGLRASALPLSGVAALVVALFLAGLLWELVVACRSETIRTGANLGAGLLCASYVALFGGVSILRATQGFRATLPTPNADPGFLLVLLVLCCVWSTDTAAYYVGTSLGVNKLAPHLSPAKTVEGAVAGLAVAVTVGAILGHFLLGRAVLGWWIGATAGVAGQLGDLFESALKRELGIKDFGTLIPGHGGVLDRFDSLLFTAPVVWMLVLALG